MIEFNSIMGKQQEIEQKINSIKEKMKLYEEEIVLLKEQQNKIRNVDIYNRDISLDVITHLVSRIEEKKHICKKKNICSWFRYYGEENDLRYIEYILVYLVEEDMEKEAEAEIGKRFPKQPDRKLNENYYIYQNRLSNYMVNSAEKFPELLDTPSDNYIQLAYYKEKEDDNEIVYLKDSSFDNTIQMGNDVTIKYSKICDERYYYIIDFMDSVTEYKLLKPDYNVTQEEMYKLADNFAENYKLEKKSTNKY